MLLGLCLNLLVNIVFSLNLFRSEWNNNIFLNKINLRHTRNYKDLCVCHCAKGEQTNEQPFRFIKSLGLTITRFFYYNIIILVFYKKKKKVANVTLRSQIRIVFYDVKFITSYVSAFQKKWIWCFFDYYRWL